MDKLERKLNALPRYGISPRADLVIRKRIFFALLKRDIAAWRLQLSLPRLVRPVAVVCGLALIFSLPVYAYANPGVHLGHPLYPMKANLEQLEGLLVDDSGEAAVYYAKLSERRLAEAEKIAAKGEDPEKLKATIQAARQNSEFSQAEAASAGAKPEVAEKLEAKREGQKTILIGVAQQVGIAQDEELTDTIASALEEAKTPPIMKSNDGKSSATSVTRAAATSSVAARTIDRTDIKEKKNKIETAEAMDQVQSRIQELKGQLRDDYDADQVNRLFDLLDKKMVEARERIDNNDLPAAAGLLNSTEALTNNAKHFLKPKKTGQEDFNDADKGRGKKRDPKAD